LTAILRIWSDTSVIIGVVVLNVIIGFIQEGKGEAAIEALKKMMVPDCIVLRDGEEKSISARELVPGDVVLLEGGDGVPADLRLFGTKNLKADESMLTGESLPVGKQAVSIARPDLPPGEQQCIAFSGTFITQGRGLGIVVSTGERTEFGKIAMLMKETRKITTPLMRKIADFTKILIYGILALAVLNMILSVVFKYDLVYAFLASVALAVAAIPEMLPAVVSAILALAAVAMAKRNALIRKLPAAETLGCTTVICSDKTGTLTKNQMTVVGIYCGGQDYRVNGVGYEPRGEFILNGKSIDLTQEHLDLTETLRAGYLCNNASLLKTEGSYSILGDPTEGALVVSARKAGIIEKLPRLDEIPFESEQQYMAAMYEGESANIVYVKGSPERILKMCQSQLINGSIGTLDSERISEKAEEMAKDALRVLAMAYKPIPRDRVLSDEEMEGLTFLGLQGMIDPPREEAIEAVEKCKKAGVRTVMITGDHAQTARAVAIKLGINDRGDRVITGEELARMSDDALYQAVDEVSVYARVAPEHKLRIAKQLQQKGHITAVTGDGVNDAPALKAADIGISMGKTGTEVSKQASDMVLTDDNFASIVGAVEEGRHVWKNLQKAILYTLPTNGGQAFLVMGAVLLAPFIPLFAFRLPLEPIHILWVNLADSVFLTLPLMLEPKEKNLLESQPRSQKEKIANQLFWERVGVLSLVMACAGFAIYYHFGMSAFSGTVDEFRVTQAQTAAFMGVQLLHVGYLISARSIMKSAFTFSPFSNKWVLIGIAIHLVSMFIIVYFPPVQAIFRTAAFPSEWWTLIIFAIFPGFFYIEIEKFLRRLLGKTEE